MPTVIQRYFFYENIKNQIILSPGIIQTYRKNELISMVWNFNFTDIIFLEFEGGFYSVIDQIDRDEVWLIKSSEIDLQYLLILLSEI